MLMLEELSIKWTWSRSGLPQLIWILWCYHKLSQKSQYLTIWQDFLPTVFATLIITVVELQCMLNQFCTSLTKSNKTKARQFELLAVKIWVGWYKRCHFLSTILQSLRDSKLIVLCDLKWDLVIFCIQLPAGIFQPNAIS